MKEIDDIDRMLLYKKFSDILIDHGFTYSKLGESYGDYGGNYSGCHYYKHGDTIAIVNCDFENRGLFTHTSEKYVSIGDVYFDTRRELYEGLSKYRREEIIDQILDDE